MLLLVAISATASLCRGRGVAQALSAGYVASGSIESTDSPPLVDVPVWSMATMNDDGTTTNMNLLTYATPVSIRPTRLYALGLYKGTLSRDNFLRDKTCILQLLSASDEKHVECVRLLGGSSGNDLSKEDELSSVHGIELQVLDGSDDDKNQPLPKVLPGCVRYLQLSMVGDEVTDYDGGESSHDVVICKVDKMWTTKATPQGLESDGQLNSDGGTHDEEHLSTRQLRKLGLITEQGRIAPLPEE